MTMPRIKNERVKKVFVGLSGGVDSSVSAALLKKAGYDVTGVFIKVWQPDFIECIWKDDRLDAMRVCAKLGIPLIELNLEKEYKKEVVDYMIREYRAGRTPNPDVMCNRYVKFGGFYDWAMAQGADYVATGHYARIADGGRLLAGSDPQKDQSYFLWHLRREQLPHILFPVGAMLKSEVRKLARRFGLVTADKKDSQGLCFLGKIDMKEFLKNYIKPESGNVLNEQGEIIGWHDGAVFFTLGERHSFTVRTAKTRTDADRTRTDADKNQRPYYVVAKNVKKNTLTVSHDPRINAGGRLRTVFEVKEVNCIGRAPQSGARLSARLRYRQPLQKVIIIIQDSRFKIQFYEPQTGGAPGQSVVFYKGDACLGGGIIT